MNPADSLKQMRMIHAVLISALGLYAYLGERMAGKNTGGFSAPILYCFILVNCLDLLLAYYFRRTKLFPALEELRRDPKSLGALKSWRFSTILTMVLLLSIGLYGFALRFMGAPQRIVWPFYLVALSFFLIWRPNLEITAELAEPRPNQ